MAPIFQIVVAILSVCCLFLSVVQPHRIVLRNDGFHMNLKDLALISPSKAVKDGETSASRPIWKTGVLEFFEVGSEAESEVSFGPEVSISFPSSQGKIFSVLINLHDKGYILSNIKGNCAFDQLLGNYKPNTCDFCSFLL